MDHENISFYDEYQSIWPQLLSVEQCITEQVQTSDPHVAPILQELTERRGKMLRPAMLLFCGKLLSDLKTEHIHLAAIVELIHMASLLHDDVIDKAQLRRGKPSANALWGNTVAVLLGDYLLSRAFTLASHSQLNGAAAVLGQTTQALCTGEIKQNLITEKRSLTEAEYMQIIEAKTATLFQCSCQLGALCSGGTEQQVDALGEFGFQFGRAFQMADDLRDLLSSEAQEGKTLGTDLQEGKLTLPMVHWIQQDSSQQQDRLNALLDETNVTSLADQLRQAGSVDYTLGCVRMAFTQAERALDIFAASPDKEALVSLSNRVISGIN